jgi:acetolactate synthase-1/2/3 large subunit
MGVANPLWGAPRIHGELLKLGMDVGQTRRSTWRKDDGRRRRAGGPFVHNHADCAMQLAEPARNMADPADVSKIAHKLLDAKKPILITAYGGRNPTTSKMIEAVTEFAGIAIFEPTPVNNISREGSCFMGFSPDDHVPSADFGLLVDVDVPWLTHIVKPNPATYWAQIDVDTLKSASPIWGFPSNLQGGSARILEVLLEQPKDIATPAFRALAAERVEEFKLARAMRISEGAKLAAVKGVSNAINPHYLFWELGRLLDPRTISYSTKR